MHPATTHTFPITSTTNKAETGKAISADERGKDRNWGLTCLHVSTQDAGAWARSVGVHVTGARRDLWAPVLALLVSLAACVYCVVQLAGAVRPCAPSAPC